MNMNRRSFFRFFGRATGTAAAVVVGGAALSQVPGNLASFIKIGGRWHELPIPEYGTEDWKTWHARTFNRQQWNAVQREMLASAKQKSPIF